MKHPNWKRALAAALCAAIGLSLLPTSAWAQETEQTGTYSYAASAPLSQAPSGQETAVRTASCAYCDDWFFQDPAQENLSLAALSMSLVLSSSAEGDDWSRYARDLLAGLGFQDIHTNQEPGYAPALSAAEDARIPCLMAHKPITGPTGTVYELLLTLPRSFRYGTEWAGNFRVGPSGTKDGLHQGFSEAADYVSASLAQYRQTTLSGSGAPTVLWVTGHSRGGAVANLAGARLADSLASSGAAPQTLYVYTFACPNVGTLPAQYGQVQARYAGIHNYISAADPVPLLPPAQLDQGQGTMGRYGVDHSFDPAQAGDGFFSALQALNPALAADYDRQGRPEDFSPLEISPKLTFLGVKVSDLLSILAADAVSQLYQQDAEHNTAQRIDSVLNSTVPLLMGYFGDKLGSGGLSLDLSGVVSPRSGGGMTQQAFLADRSENGLLAGLDRLSQGAPRRDTYVQQAQTGCAALAGLFFSMTQQQKQVILALFTTGENRDANLMRAAETLVLLYLYCATDQRAAAGDPVPGQLLDKAEATLGALLDDLYPAAGWSGADGAGKDLSDNTRGVAVLLAYLFFGLSDPGAAPEDGSVDPLWANQLDEFLTLLGSAPRLLYAHTPEVYLSWLQAQAGTGPSAGPGGAAQGFSDVPANAWYKEGVDFAVANDLMNGVGDGRFDPDGVTTRAMAVTILCRMAAGAPTSSGGFSDVEENAWYTDAVNWAAENGIVNGYSDGRFGPSDPVTREQLAAILYRYAQTRGQGGGVSPALDYPDAASVSAYAYEPLCWMTAHGVITGAGDGTLLPGGQATRAQLAVILLRFCAAADVRA